MAHKTNSPDSQWRLSSGDSCAWSDFGDGYVGYHRPSGKTHLLNEAGYRLLTELLLEPKDLATIAAEYDPGHQGTSSEDYLRRMRQMLRRLEQFGLIERE